MLTHLEVLGTSESLPSRDQVLTSPVDQNVDVSPLRLEETTDIVNKPLQEHDHLGVCSVNYERDVRTSDTWFV